MDFKFNFCVDEGSDKEEEVISTSDQDLPSTSSPDSAPVARQIPVLQAHWDTVQNKTPTEYSIPNSRSKLRYISGTQCSSINGGSSNSGMELKSLLALTDSEHSDLIPGMYEGGLKVWECAFDLVHYLSELECDFTGKSVLELGCGAGLPGIFALTKGAKNVHFQDYNPEVIDCTTVPNVLFNSEAGDKDIEHKVKFYCGDWSKLTSELVGGSKYDVILTSETIYSLDSQPKLLAVLKQLSRQKTGVVYVAAKSFYFGVGGGVESFSQLVREDGTFCVSTCKEIQASVPRIILKLTHNNIMW